MRDSPTGMIEIIVNGEPREVPGGLTLAALLQFLGLDPARLAVELNRRIIQKDAWATTPIAAGARLEIVQFVGGG